MTTKLFETALGIEAPWYVRDVSLDMAAHTLTIFVDFTVGSRFPHPEVEGLHPAYDTTTKRYRHLNFFQHECCLEVRVPRIQLPDGAVRMIEPSWAGKLAGFTLLFEAIVLMLCQQMTFAACARLVNESWHRVAAIYSRYVDLALAEADFSDVRAVAIDETSRCSGHNYVTLAADAKERAVIFVTEGKDADAVAALAEDLRAHGGDPEAIESVSIDMSPAYIRGVADHLPNAEITFDKFHVIAHASKAVDKTRRAEQKSDPDLKGLRWVLLKDRSKLDSQQQADLDTLLAHMTTKRTARAWLYREQLRDILDRKQVNVVRRLLLQWCVNVMRSKVEPMKEVAELIRNHIEGIVSWAKTRQTNGFLEALNGLFQAAKRKARGYVALKTIRTVIFLLIGKLNFSRINPYVGLPT
jgi:transposase